MTVKNSATTEAISFRLEKENLDRLREFAAQRKESLNSLVSRILDKYVKVWIFDQSYSFFAMNRRVIQLAVGNLNDNEIEKIAIDQARNVHKEIILFLFGALTKETVIKYLDVFSSRFEKYRYFKNGRRHTLTVLYHMGVLQFSKLYYEKIRVILALVKIDILDCEKDIGENGFAISFEADV